MAIKGSLRAASLPDVIQMLSVGRKSGVLSVTNGEIFIFIYFENGKITGLDSVNRQYRIGELLIKNGSITEEQLENALMVQKENKDKLLGEILLEMKFIDENALKKAITEQVKEGLYNAFTWEDGYFSFEPGESKVKKVGKISIDAQDLLLEAARIVDELSIMQLPSYSDILIKTSTDIEKLNEKEKEVFSIIDGKKSMENVLSDTKIDEFEAMKIIGRLIKNGYIKAIKPSNIPIEKALSKITEHENLGVAFLYMEMFVEAEREFRRILEIDPLNVKAKFFISIIKFYRNEIDNAITLLKEIINMGNLYPSIYANLSFFYEKKGDIDEAIKIVDEGLKKWPDEPKLLLNKAILMIKKGEVENVEEIFEKIKETESNNPVIYFFWGILLWKKKKINEAINIMIAGLKLNPQFPEYYNNLGRFYEESEEYEKAESMFKKAIEIKPDFIPALKNIGDFYYKNGYYSLANEEYEKLLDMNYKDADICFRKGNIALKKGDFNEAYKMWSEGLVIEPENELLKRNLEILKKDYGFGTI
uniref:Tetratricopeptide repeat protein n=1 Tax=candidate division WOR-3 bacterium TaxID=2052148 RepID=A0A7C4YC60_UNCW3